MCMVRLRVLDILQERGLTKYWLWKRMDMSYDNFNHMVQNETQSIRYEIIDRLICILDCPIEDLFEVTEDEAKK